MAAALAKTDGIGTLSGVANLAGLFLGSNSTVTNSGGTTTVTESGGTTTMTQQESVSQAAVDALVNSILSGTQGLAAVSSGQKGAGLYNSSTNSMLVNDLIARSAAEGAKLNKTTTNTTVTSPTTRTQVAPQTTSTTVTPAKINPITAAGALAGLQMIPKDVKNSILKGLGIKTAGTAAASSASSSDDLSTKVAAPSGNGDFGYDQSTGAAVGTDGLSQAIGGLSAYNDFSESPLDFGPQQVTDDSSFISSISDFLSTSDTSAVDSVIDSVTSLADTDIIDTAADFFSGGADVVDAGDIFDDFSWDFADGGLVSKTGQKKAMGEHAAKKIQRKGFADGGYIANTGLRRVSDIAATGKAAGIGAQSIGQARQGIAAPTRVLNAPGKIVSATGQSAQSASQAAQSSEPDQSSDSPENVGIGEVSGLANALGVSQGVAKGGMSALGMALGSPLGALGGIANARDNNQAVKSAGLTVLGMVSPGLAIGAKVADMLGLFGGGSGKDMGTESPFGGMSVNSGMGPQSTTADMQSLGTDPLGGTSPDFSGPTTGTETDAYGGSNSDSSSSNGADTGSTGAGSSSGSSVGGNYKSGGEVNGPGTGTSDSIPVNLSDGEYVLPADVVKALGIDTLDNIVARIHKPAKRK